jgi:hypothetical protein
MMNNKNIGAAMENKIFESVRRTCSDISDKERFCQNSNKRNCVW